MKPIYAVAVITLSITYASVSASCEKCGYDLCCCEISNIEVNFPELYQFLVYMIEQENHEFAAYLYLVTTDNPELASKINEAIRKSHSSWGRERIYSPNLIMNLEVMSDYQGGINWQ